MDEQDEASTIPHLLGIYPVLEQKDEVPGTPVTYVAGD
jgi:hypothetical protein